MQQINGKMVKIHQILLPTPKKLICLAFACSHSHNFTPTRENVMQPPVAMVATNHMSAS